MAKLFTIHDIVKQAKGSDEFQEALALTNSLKSSGNVDELSCALDSMSDVLLSEVNEVIVNNYPESEFEDLLAGTNLYLFGREVI